MLIQFDDIISSLNSVVSLLYSKWYSFYVLYGLNKPASILVKKDRINDIGSAITGPVADPFTIQQVWNVHSSDSLCLFTLTWIAVGIQSPPCVLNHIPIG